MVASPNMDLHGRRVLIDGRNLELRQGTGLKTYGLTLIEALTGLGASPKVLLSRQGVYGLFGDAFADWTRARRCCALFKAMLRAPFKVEEQRAMKDIIITRGLSEFDFINHAGLFLLPNAYDLADQLNRLHTPMNLRVSPSVDIWHTTVPSWIDVLDTPKITTIHDLIPLRLPHTTLDQKATIADLVRSAIASSKLLITISECTKRDLIDFFGVPPEKIAVTYQPIALDPAPPTDKRLAQVLRYYELQRGNYILFVGAIEPKKNLSRLLRAMAMIETDLPLVVAGGKGWLVEQELAPLEKHPALRQRVRFLDYVPSDELSALYAGARCLAFPSLYEGFGLPPLEAMNFGCPVLTSNVASLPEVCGDAALYADPYKPTDIADQLACLIDDANLRTRLIQAGYERAKAFSPENYQKRLHDAYARALS
jgi:glycosyltransferase involved in cell wall biosynthesis